jgi:hypothetical protein
MTEQRSRLCTARRRSTTLSVPLLAAILVLLVCTPEARGSEDPYITGDVACPDTGAAVNVRVRISTPFRTYETTTDWLGRFGLTVSCPDCDVSVTVGSETRTLTAVRYTDYGTWIYDAVADGDPSTYCGCWPRISGKVTCDDGETGLLGKTVSIYQAESETCPAQNLTAITDEDGLFYRCVCDNSWVHVTYDSDTRTAYVTDHTDFGTWISDMDQDGDGWSFCGADCNDRNNKVYPGAIEWCDELDNDCDGEVDEGCIPLQRPTGSPIFRKPNPVVDPGGGRH